MGLRPQQGAMGLGLGPGRGCLLVQILFRVLLGTRHVVSGAGPVGLWSPGLAAWFLSNLDGSVVPFPTAPAFFFFFSKETFIWGQFQTC